MAGDTQDAEAERADLDRRVEALTVWARKNLSFEEAIRRFSLYKAIADSLSVLLEQSNTDHEKTLKRLNATNSGRAEDAAMLHDAGKTLSVVPEWLAKAHVTGLQVSKAKATKRGRLAAEIRHNQPGGSRSKADAIRTAWASGKYTSRDRCAEEECAALDMSLSSARRALRNTPNPS